MKKPVRQNTLEQKTMTTLTGERINTGDVLEFTLDGRVVSALVLLATDTAVILDACDGSTPFVLQREELVDIKVFCGNEG